MKKVYFLLVALSIWLLAIDINAQTYKPCLIEGAEWSIFKPTMVKYGNPHDSNMIPFVIQITDKTDDDYYRCHLSMKSNPYYESYWFYAKENHLTGQIWVRENIEDEPEIIMDMTLNVGDEITFHTLPYKVSKVYYDEQNRKCIEFEGEAFHYYYYCNIYSKLIFIESVGPTFSFLPDYKAMGGQVVICKQGNMELEYAIDSPHFSGCMPTGIDDAIMYSDVFIYPNPVENYLTIDAGGMIFDNITIFDINGKVLCQQIVMIMK